MKRKWEEENNDNSCVKKIKIDKKRAIEHDEPEIKKMYIISSHFEEENNKLKEIIQELLKEINFLKFENEMIKEENNILKNSYTVNYGLYPHA